MIENTRLCPDFSKLKDIWKIKNSYSNIIDRDHFHVEVIICNSATNNNCKLKTDIDSLLQKIFFTMTNAYGKAELKNKTNHAAHPITIIEEFHS